MPITMAISTCTYSSFRNRITPLNPARAGVPLTARPRYDRPRAVQ